MQATIDSKNGSYSDDRDHQDGDDFLFEAIFESSPFGIALVSPDGQWLRCNQRLCDMLGYSCEELRTTTFQDITHPDDLLTDLTFLQETLGGQRNGYQIEKRYISKNGAVLWIQLTTSIVRYDDGRPRYFVSYVEDIQKRKEVDSRLESAIDEYRLQTERLAIATRSAAMGVWDWNVGADWIHWDDQMFDLYGMEPPERGRINFDIWKASVHPDDLDGVMRKLDEMTAGTASFDTVFRILNPKRGVRFIEVHAEAIHDLSGRLVRMIGVNLDITEQETWRREREATTESARRASMAKSDFLAMISHEIRTPLNGIIGYSKLLWDTELHDEQREFLSSIELSGKMLLAIVNDVLDYSKIEAGKLDLEQIAFPVRKSVRSAVEMVSIAAQRKNLSLNVRFGAHIPAEVIGDSTRLTQVLLNLLSNAVKFTSEGGVQVDVSRVSDSHKDRLKFVVADTGIGISALRIAELFQPFNQLDASTTRRFGGTGLGLAISHRLISLMGGRIYLESTEGVGTKATVEIPLLQVETPVCASGDGAGRKPSSIARSPTSSSRSRSEPKQGIATLPESARDIRILLVEDNSINQRLMRSILQRMGLQHIHLANDGSEAVNLCAEEIFDVILMDYQMPIMDGGEAARAIRRLESENPKRSRAHIVALTAAALPEDRTRSLDAGMNDHLTKPLQPHALHQILSSVGGKKRRS